MVRLIRLASTAVCSLLLFASFAVAAEKPLIVAADATWPPMEFLNEEKALIGYSIDYINAVAKEAGLNVEVRNTAWDGIFAALGSRQADIIASSVTVTDKRKKAMAFSEPYCAIYQAVVTPVGVEITSLQDLEGKTIGGQIGTTGLVETMPKSKVKATIKTYDEVGLALEDLGKGTLDAVICDGPVAAYYANKKEEYKGKFHVAYKTPDAEYFAFALRKDDADLLKKVNEGMKAVKEKGIEKEIIAKWLGE